jgi:hypothetical protein
LMCVGGGHFVNEHGIFETGMAVEDVVQLALRDV